jgi:hypothetical protein
MLNAPDFLKEALSKSWYAFYYAEEVLDGPFPLGEIAIANAASESLDYAANVLKGPFPLGEPALATNCLFSYWYAQEVLKAPFPLGELAISKDPKYQTLYKEFLTTC